MALVRNLRPPGSYVSLRRRNSGSENTWSSSQPALLKEHILVH